MNKDRMRDKERSLKMEMGAPNDPIDTPRFSREESRRDLERFSTVSSEKTSSYQENRGKRWSTEEDMYLLQQITFMSYSDIGKHLRRSENAVLSRLKKLAFHMIQNGEDPQVVQTNLHLTNEDMEQINNECFIYPKKTTSKFITSTKKTPKKGYFAVNQQTPEMQLLLEIRSMLRKMMYHLNESGNMKSPKREMSQIMNRFCDLNLDDLERRSEEFAKMN